MAKKLKITLKRKCPSCNCLLEYWYKRSYQNAIENKSKCCSCKQIGRKFTKEHRKKLSIAKLGKSIHPNVIKKRVKTRQKNGWFTEKTIQKISKAKLGHIVSQEVRNKIGKTVREYRFNEIKEKYGIKFPNYNPKACKIIEECGKQKGYNFQHAENGGEVCIDGYWPDGVDKKRKTIIEIDEKHHFNTDGTYKEKDIERQKYLENLGYKVIRIRI